MCNRRPRIARDVYSIYRHHRCKAQQQYFVQSSPPFPFRLPYQMILILDLSLAPSYLFFFSHRCAPENVYIIKKKKRIYIERERYTDIFSIGNGECYFSLVLFLLLGRERRLQSVSFAESCSSKPRRSCMQLLGGFYCTCKPVGILPTCSTCVLCVCCVCVIQQEESFTETQHGLKKKIL